MYELNKQCQTKLYDLTDINTFRDIFLSHFTRQFPLKKRRLKKVLYQGKQQFEMV